MVEFAYNNAKNANISYILFEINCNYHFKILVEEDVNLRLKIYSANKLVEKLRELIKVCS